MRPLVLLGHDRVYVTLYSFKNLRISTMRFGCGNAIRFVGSMVISLNVIRMVP